MPSVEYNQKGTILRCRCTHSRTYIKIYRGMRDHQPYRIAERTCSHCEISLGTVALEPPAYYAAEGYVNMPRLADSEVL